MDRPALPVLPSPAHAPGADLHRNAHHRRGAARRSRAAARLRCLRASGRAPARRQRSGGARAIGAHRRRLRLRRDQSQCRLSVRPRAGGPLRRLPDGGAGAGRRLRRRHEGRGQNSGDREVPHRHRRAGPGPGAVFICRCGQGGRRRCVDRACAQGLAEGFVAAREPRRAAARLCVRAPAQGRASRPRDRAQWRHRQPRAGASPTWRMSTA